MQQLTCKMVRSFSFISFKKELVLRKSWGKILKKCEKKCEKVSKRCCPLVVALLFFSDFKTGVSDENTQSRSLSKFFVQCRPFITEVATLAVRGLAPLQICSRGLITVPCSAEWGEAKVPPLFAGPLFSIKHPQDNFSLQKCKLTPSKIQMGEGRGEFLTKTAGWRSPIPFWGVPMYILESANLHFAGWNCLGCSYRNRRGRCDPQKGEHFSFLRPAKSAKSNFRGAYEKALQQLLTIYPNRILGFSDSGWMQTSSLLFFRATKDKIRDKTTNS